MGKCPKCSAFLTSVNLDGIEIHVNGKNRWHGSAYTCPVCQAIVSVSIDPIALRTDIIEKVVEELKSLLKR